MSFRKIGARILVSLVAVLLSSSLVSGQEHQGTIFGRTVDPSGAVIPGASVKITNSATGVSVTLTTNDQGAYLALYLIPGIYGIEVEHRGFKRVLRDGIELRVNDRLEVNLTLEVGGVTEQVTVVAETPLLETTTASMGQVVDARRVADLPIANGQLFNLIQLTPGATFPGDLKQDRQYENAAAVEYTMNGTRGGHSDITVDGVAITSTLGGNEVTASITPPVDAVAEFKVQTAPFDASVGQTEGGVTNVALKSGTNALHGTAYYVRMDPTWNANTFFGNRLGEPRGDFDYNRGGGMVSGPVVLPGLYDGRKRTFFVYAAEYTRDERIRGGTLTVPTAAQREGNFSDLLKLGAQYQIYDPATRRREGARFRSDPLAGNVVPGSRISPIARKILDYFALPNNPGTADGKNNLALPNAPESTIYHSHSIRGDHYLSERHRVFGRAAFARRDSQYSNWFKSAATGRWFGAYPFNAALDDVYSFSSSFVMNTRLGASRGVRSENTNPAGHGLDLTTLGLPASYNDAIPVAVRRFPRIAISDYYTTEDYWLWRATETLTAAIAFDKMWGSHMIKFGVEYRVYRESQLNPGNVSAGNFIFGTDWTRGPLDNSPASPIGQGLASMLLGLPTGGGVERRASYAEHSTAWSFYLQDNWKLTRKLMVNLGLRYEVESPLTERFNRSVRGLDFKFVQPLEAQVQANYAKSPTPEVPTEAFLLRGGLTFEGVGGESRNLWERDTNNFMPRVGFAYHLAPKTVVRVGYGIFFGFLGARRGDVIQTGFSRTTSLVPSLDGGLTFRATLANPFPDGILEPLGAAQGPLTNLGQSISFFNPKPLAPYMQRWQFGIQQELPHQFVVELGYVGNRGTKIDTSRDLKATPLEYLSKSPVRDQAKINYLSTNLPNPFYPLLPSTGLSSALSSRISLLGPYPHFTGLSTTSNEGYSWYHSMQAKVEKRFSRGYTFLAAYTWSKFMEATSFLNAADPVPYRQISDQDYPHRVSVSGILELPFGRKRRFLPGVNPAASAILSGWQVQGLYAYQTGKALSFGNVIFFGDLKDIPLPRGQRTPERWFNIDAGFERDSAKQLSYNVRTFPARFSGIRGAPINNFDLSVIKDTRIREGMKVQFRGEFLNALNHAMFADPNTSPTSLAFGVVTAEKGYPRRVQLGIKLFF